MKAIVLERLGGPDVLKLKEFPKPVLYENSNDVLVNLKYSGINFAEILARRGLYKWVPQKKGFILGMEGSGIIEAIGDKVNTLKEGDSVIVVGNYGCHAEYGVFNEKYVFPAIPKYSLELNAAFISSFMTAYIALVKMARVKNTEKILIHAAAGALGTAAVQIAKALDLEVAGTASNSIKIELLKKLKVDLSIDYSKINFRESIMQWSKQKGVDVILESVGGKIFQDSMKCLAPMGRVVIVGASSIRFNKFNPFTWLSAYRTIPRVRILRMLGKSQAIFAFHLGRLLESNYEDIRRILEELIFFVQKNNIKPIIGKIFPLNDISKAHFMIESRNNIGKIVLKI